MIQRRLRAADDNALASDFLRICRFTVCGFFAPTAAPRSIACNGNPGLRGPAR